MKIPITTYCRFLFCQYQTEYPHDIFADSDSLLCRIFRYTHLLFLTIFGPSVERISHAFRVVAWKTRCSLFYWGPVALGRSRWLAVDVRLQLRSFGVWFAKEFTCWASLKWSLLYWDYRTDTFDLILSIVHSSYTDFFLIFTTFWRDSDNHSLSKAWPSCA